MFLASPSLVRRRASLPSLLPRGRYRPSICEKRESPRRRRRCPKKREKELCSFRLEEEGAFSGFRGGEGSFCLVGGCAESCSGRRKLSSLSLLLLLVVLLLLLLEPGHTHKGGGGRSVLPQLAFCFRIWHEVREGEGGGATPNVQGVLLHVLNLEWRFCYRGSDS